MAERKFSELIFETSNYFIDDNLDVRNFDSDFVQIAITSETDDAYVLTSYYPVNNPVYTRHFSVTGEFSMSFRVEATVTVNKARTSMSLAQGFYINKDVFLEPQKNDVSTYTVEGPPCSIEPDGKTILLTVHSKRARGGVILTKAVWTISKKIGDEWRDLLYKWATQ
jgi:hypothetical protein